MSAALVVIALSGGCAAPKAPPITHVVLISLADPTQSDELIAECRADLAKIPSITLFGCGRAVDTDRANVDGNYDVGLVIGFDSEEGYRRYVEDPVHVRLVEKWKPRWTRARIFDVGNGAVNGRTSP